MNTKLRDQILDCLHLHGQAVTYGALAGVVGSEPEIVMNDLERNYRNSWVVSNLTLLPTNYAIQQIDPKYLRGDAAHQVIRDSANLLVWLDKNCGIGRGNQPAN